MLALVVIAVAIAVLGALAVVFLKQSNQARAVNGGGQPEVRSQPLIAATQKCLAFISLHPTPAAAEPLLLPLLSCRF